MPYSGGLKRNIVQCLNDYDIPLKLSHTVIDIKGKERVEGITLAEVDGKGKPIPGTEEEYTCDTLLLSCGLIPENEISRGMGVDMNPVTSGPKVNESLETNIEGVFACGNVLHVHDLVDFVSEEAKTAGRNAAEYVKSLQADTDDKDKHNGEEETEIVLNPVEGVRYTVPSTINPVHMDENLTVRFRVVDGDVPAFPQVFHHDADRRLGVPQFPANVDGSTIATAAQQHIDRLQIVFCRFVNHHIDTPIENVLS